jgi:hypothetical protein
MACSPYDALQRAPKHPDERKFVMLVTEMGDMEQ